MGELERYFRACLDAEYTTEENDADWAVEREGDELLILFEHSRGALDWLNNLNFHAVPYPEMHPIWQCHGGFLSVWRAVKPAVEHAILPYLSLPPDRDRIARLTVIGYSHGAALAVLCHEWLWYHFPLWRAALVGYGFGCPRVLYGCPTPELAARWEQFYVIRNNDDPVTHLPPRAFGFCHAGNLLQVSDGVTSGIDAHRPESYLAALGAEQ